MKVGFTSVVGDLFHAGHVAMIQECRRHCDYLILAVVSSTRGRAWKQQPVQSLFERFFQVWNCKGVDEIYACEDEKDLLLAIQTLAPRVDIRFVGEDYRDRDFTGKEFCLANGIKLLYNKRAHGLSSSELKSRVIDAGNAKSASDAGARGDGRPRRRFLDGLFNLGSVRTWTKVTTTAQNANDAGGAEK